MRFFFLFILFCLLIGSVAEEKECKFPDEDVYVDQAFLKEKNKCTKWKGNGNNTKLWIDKDNGLTKINESNQYEMTEEQTNKAISAVETITGFSYIIIRYSNMKDVKFANLTSVKGLKQLEVTDNPFLETVSFPLLTTLVVEAVFFRNVPRLNVTSIEAILNLPEIKHVWFEEECDDITTISKATDIPSNCRFLHSLKFAKGVSGTVNAKINYIRGELSIVNTKLDNLDFLQLAPLETLLDEPCKITDNTFIYYNEKTLIEMINGVYKKCTISGNSGKPSTTTTTTTTLAPTTSTTTTLAPTTTTTTLAPTTTTTTLAPTTTTTTTSMATTSIAIKQVRVPSPARSSVRIGSSLCSFIVAFSVCVSL